MVPAKANASNGAAKPSDPLITPHLDRIAAALEHDGSDPATVLAEVEAGLDGAREARAPRVKSRAVEKASKALRGALDALRAAPTLENLVAMRAAAEQHRRAHGLPPPKLPRRRFGLAAALEDRPPPKSVCRKLEWEVGRPPMLIGPPGSGKTFIVQAAALDLIMGRPLWGCPDFGNAGFSKVLHIDLDQGAPKTLRRFKRLLRGHGVDSLEEGAARTQLAKRAGLTDPRDLERFDVDEGDGLRLLSLQPEELARWRSAWIDAVTGYDVAFIDSLRRLAPFLDENDSRFSIVPDMLRDVSEASQCVTVLLHHASNKVHHGSGPKPAPGTRGSSAIDGAAGSQLVVEQEGDAYKLTQARAGEARKLPPFFLSFEDDEARGPGGIRGIRVTYMTPEQAHAPETSAKASKLRALAAKIYLYVCKAVAKQGHGVPGRKAIVTSVEGRDRDIYAAIDLLVDEGRLKEGAELREGKKIPRIWPADPQVPETPAT